MAKFKIILGFRAETCFGKGNKITNPQTKQNKKFQQTYCGSAQTEMVRLRPKDGESVRSDSESGSAVNYINNILRQW